MLIKEYRITNNCSNAEYQVGPDIRLHQRCIKKIILSYQGPIGSLFFNEKINK